MTKPARTLRTGRIEPGYSDGVLQHVFIESGLSRRRSSALLLLTGLQRWVRGEPAARGEDDELGLFAWSWNEGL